MVLGFRFRVFGCLVSGFQESLSLWGSGLKLGEKLKNIEKN